MLVISSFSPIKMRYTRTNLGEIIICSWATRAKVYYLMGWCLTSMKPEFNSSTMKFKTILKNGDSGSGMNGYVLLIPYYLWEDEYWTCNLCFSLDFNEVLPTLWLLKALRNSLSIITLLVMLWDSSCHWSEVIYFSDWTHSGLLLSWNWDKTLNNNAFAIWKVTCLSS